MAEINHQDHHFILASREITKPPHNHLCRDLLSPPNLQNPHHHSNQFHHRNHSYSAPSLPLLTSTQRIKSAKPSHETATSGPSPTSDVLHRSITNAANPRLQPCPSLSPRREPILPHRVASASVPSPCNPATVPDPPLQHEASAVVEPRPLRRLLCHRSIAHLVHDLHR